MNHKILPELLIFHGITMAAYNRLINQKRYMGDHNTIANVIL
jgi:hypothetical protein